MDDEKKDVDTGSETTSNSAETTASEQSAAETTATDTSANEAATAATDASADAGGAADETKGTDEGTATDATDPDASRTGFVEKGNPGDECTCPDGRKGTIHKFDNGLICIPNEVQG